MKMRTRHTVLLGGSVALLVALLATDPDKGVTTGIMLMSLASGLLAVLCAHVGRKALHDYPEADARRLFSKAGEHPIGAGLALVALAIVMLGLLMVFAPRAQAAGIPPQAEPLLPVLQAEIRQAWPDHPMPAYFGGLIEHESACPRPRSCWRPTAQLKTQREEGAGLGQLTRAYRPDGSTRFDALAEMRAAHPALRELDWRTIYQRPDLQLRAVVLKSRDDWRAIGPAARMEFVDLAYNAGRGRVSQDRRACAMTAGCDPAQWWGHVERTCTASRAPIYGNRSACDISRHHVADVLARAAKYAGRL
ncbi:MAG: hypothetical protein ACK44A_05510 [Roseateles sp.]